MQNSIPSYHPNFNEEHSAKLPALTLLCNLGYTYIPPKDCDAMRQNQRVVENRSLHNDAERKSSQQVILRPILKNFLQKQRFSYAGKPHSLSDATINKIIQELSPAMNSGLKRPNEKIYNSLVYGITVTEFINGKKVSPTIAIIDWQNPDNNQYHVTEEFIVQNSGATGNRIPDIVCFVNGLPLVIIEAKRPKLTKSGDSNQEGISQHIRNQEQGEIPHLYAYSQLLLSINGHDGLYATTITPLKFWAKWKEERLPESLFKQLKNQTLEPAQFDAIFAHRKAETRASYLSLIHAGELDVTDQDRLLISLLKPERLLEMTRLFILFDKKNGKIVARYPQVFGIKAMLERITTLDENGAREGGVIWHTTGSGKSLTMVFLSKALIWLDSLAQCRIIVVTDRVDLEKQLSDTFASGGVFSEKEKRHAVASSGRQLAQQIGQGNQRVIFSIINKFGSAIQHKICYNDSPNIIVLVDEGHRSQNGENNIQMQQMLPNAAFIAFTGTPLLKDDKTENKFGKIIHAYTMQQAVEDQTVTPLLYEERIPELAINERAIDAWFDRNTSQLSSKQKSDLKRKFSQKGEIYKTEGRIELIAYDISDHFQNFKQQGLKGQLACDSKASAVRYKQMLDKIGLVTSVVAMSAPDTREGHEAVDQESKDIVQNWWKENVQTSDEKAYTDSIINAYGREDGPDIMIVVDKLLTGFDEPKNSVLYIDKPLKEHNLIQAIARVNRLHAKKQFGLLIDYRGILKELDTTIEKYQDLAERTQGGYDINDLQGMYHNMESEYKKLPQLHKALWAIFAEVKNKQQGNALRHALAPKIEDINGTLTDTNLKKREDFYDALTAFANCMKVALQSASYFDDKSFDGYRDRYKHDLKAFIDLRAQVRDDANETVNYDEYADDIRHLIDKHVAGVEIQDPEGVYFVNKLGKEVAKPESMSDDEARNQTDKITGRITKMIEQELVDDPYAQAHFSDLLKKAIEEAKAMFDAPVKQYMLFADLAETVKERKIDQVSAYFTNESGEINKHAQAYFGIFKQLFDGETLAEKGLNDDKIAALAFEIDKVVNTAIAEFSLNPANIENKIHNELLPMLFAELGIDEAQKVINEVIKLTRLGLHSHSLMA